MAQVNDLLVLGKANFLNEITSSQLLRAFGGIALDSSTEQSTSLEYVLGIKPFASGGNVMWSNVSDFANVMRLNASGNWGINISGTAAKATADASGNTITTTYAKVKAYNDMIHSTNEYTFASSAYSGAIWLNYRTASGSTDGDITAYNFGNGKGGTAGVTLVAESFQGALKGNANSATYTSNVRITATNPSTATTYNIPFVTGIAADTNYTVRGNESLRYKTLEGTTTTEGYGRLYLGNSTGSGTAGNKSGGILIYSSGTSYQLLLAHPSAANGDTAASSRTTYLRDYGATAYLVATTTRNAVGSVSLPVYVNTSGKVTACTASSVFSAFSSATNTLSITVAGQTRTASAVNSVSNTWAAGTASEGPSITTTVNGVAGTAVRIPVATNAVCGATKVWKASDCTEYTDDTYALTCAAVQKSFNYFGWALRSRGTQFSDASITDLGTKIDRGNYYANNSTAAAAISNGPTVSSGYRLIEQEGYNGTGNGYGRRFAFNSGNHFYYQVETATRGTWNAWRQLVHQTANTAVGSGTKPTYVTADGTLSASASTVGSSTRPMYLKEGVMTQVSYVGTAYGGTGLTSFTANRMLYTSSASAIGQAHFVNASKVAINYTSEPSYNFYVSGTGYFTGDTSIAGKLIMTGNIAYTNGGNQYDIIRFVTGDVNGAGVVIGGGGTAIFGSGESAYNFQSSSGANISGATETTYITSDNTIEFYTNCQTIANRVGVILNGSRQFYPSANATGSLGTENYKWGSIWTSGTVTANKLKISNTSGVSHIEFSRESHNYIHAPSSAGTIALCANATLSLANSGLVVTNTAVHPGANKTFTLGTSSYYWGNTYVGQIYQSAGAGLTMNYNSTDYSVLVNYNNGNTGMNAAGAGLYLGYTNTNGVYFGGSGSWATINSSGITTSGIIAKAAIRLQNTSISKGTAPSESTGSYISFNDKNGVAAANRIGMIYSYLDSSNVSHMRLYAYKPVASSTDTSYLDLTYANGGATYAYYSGGYLQVKRLIATATADAAYDAANAVALITGDSAGTHLEFDGNEIFAKTSGTTAGTLYLQSGSGNVEIASGGQTTVGTKAVFKNDAAGGFNFAGRIDVGCLLLTNTGWTGYGTGDPSGVTAVKGRVYFKLI